MLPMPKTPKALPNTLEPPQPQILSRDNGEAIAYRRLAGRTPGVVFLSGFMSDMTGTKAMSLETYCRSQGRTYLRFDYSGHGASSGRFEDGTIGRWLDDALAVLDRLTSGPQILVGSSMGGWIALLAARARPDRVAGLLGIAAAPDFTEDLMWDLFSPEQKETLMRDGAIREPSEYSETPYTITRALVEDGRNHLLLRAPIEIGCPVRLIQGQRDPDVPWRTSLRIAEGLRAEDVEVTLIKSGDHRLSTPSDLDLLCRTLDALCRRVEGSA